MPQSNARVTGDFGDLIKGADNAAKSIASLGLKLSGIGVAAKGFDVATSAIGGMVNMLGKVGLAANGLAAIGQTAVSMGMGLVQGNAALEMVTISFQTLLGSASAAQDMIKQLTDFAQKTPFELTGLEANTQKLLAFGFDAKDIIPLMTSLGDAISALGGTQDNLNSLVYVMGQMRQEAHINAGDIMQMVNLGIPALQMLADHYHVTTGEIQTMITKGLIPGNEAVQIFTDSLEKKYGGMMAAQSSTFNGMLSNLQDWFKATTLILTKPLFEPAKKALAAFLNYVQSPAGVAIINKMALEIQKGVDAATRAFVAFEPKIRPTLTRLLQVAQAVRSQFTPGVFSLIPLLGQLWTRVEPLALGFLKFYQSVQPLSIALAALRGYITGNLPGALAALQNRFAMLRGYVQIAFNAALVEIKKFGPAVLSWVASTAILIANRAVVWGEAIIQWVAPYAARLIDNLVVLVGRVITWIVGYAPIIANKILDWAEALAGWVIPMIPRVLNLLAQLGFRILGWLEAEVPVLVNMLLAWTDVLVSWVLPAIPGIIAALEKVGAAILNWGVYRLPQIMGQIAVGVGQAFGLNLRPVVGDVLVVFYSLVNSIRSTVLPAFHEMIGYLESDGMPLFNRLSAFIAGTIIPTFASLAAFAMTTVVPVFVTIADLLGRVFGPALTLVGSLIRNELLPYLTALWQKFEDKNLTAVQTLATRLGQNLAGGVALAVARFKEILPHLQNFFNAVAPIAGKVWEVYSAISPLSIAIDTLNGFLTGGVQGALDAFTGHMGRIGDLFTTLIPQILSGLGTAIPQILSWIEEQAPVIFETLGKWADSFGKLAEKVMPPLLNALGKVIGGLLDWVTANGPSILKQLGEWAGQFSKWAQGMIPILLNKLGDLVNSIITFLGDHAGDILGPLGEWAGKLVEWVAGLIAQIYPKLGEFTQKLWDWIGQQAPGFADKLSEWAGAFVNWIITQAIPNMVQMLPKIWLALLKFFGEIELNIAKEVLKWVGAFLGWIPDVVSKLPGALWNIITGIGGWVGSVAGNLIQVAGNIGSAIIQGIIQTIHDAPGKIWDAVTGVLGSGAINIIKGIVQTVANFFVDVVNTPINLIDGMIETLRNIDFPIVGKILSWMPTIPKLGYLQFAKGTMSAPGGPSLVGENGAELVNLGGNRLILAVKPMLLDLPKGAQVYTAAQTRAMMPASAQQISNMYATTNANRSWDYSQTNSNSNNRNSNNTYYVNNQPVNRWSYGQQVRWYGTR